MAFYNRFNKENSQVLKLLNWIWVIPENKRNLAALFATSTYMLSKLDDYRLNHMYVPQALHFQN